MYLIIEVLEEVLPVSVHVNLTLWLVDVHVGGPPVVGEVLVEGHPRPLGGSVRGDGSGGGSWCGGSGSGSGGRHPEGRCCGVLRPVVHLCWLAVVHEVDINLDSEKKSVNWNNLERPYVGMLRDEINRYFSIYWNNRY